MNERYVNIVYCCSDLFSEVCAVSIVSLFENNRHIETISVFIIEDHFSENNRKRFIDMANKYDRTITLIPMLLPSEFYLDERFTFDTVGRTYGRMILGDVLPQSVNKVISLDSDTIILGDIGVLWDFDVEGCPIAGVDDCMGKVAMVKTQHLKEDTKHCNAGMYLIDLDVWRKEEWTKLFESYIKNLFDLGISLGGYEEEVITHTLSDRFYLLPPRFNLMTLELVLSYKELIFFRQPLNYYTEVECDNAKKNPVITHTTNFFYVKKRIFEENSDHPMRANYEKFRALTPWKNDQYMNANYSFKHDLMKNIWHCLPRSLALLIARFVRNEVRPLLKKKRDDI